MFRFARAARTSPCSPASSTCPKRYTGWGAPKIAAELALLGHGVADWTVAKYVAHPTGWVFGKSGAEALAAVGAEVFGSMVPGVGLAQDLSVIRDPHSPNWARWLAGGSLALELTVVGSVAPNAGGFLRGATRQVALKSAHGARHLESTGLAAEAVELAITRQVQTSTQGMSQVGEFWGRVGVSGQTIEYRAFPLPDGTINVGTYYPVHP